MLTASRALLLTLCACASDTRSAGPGPTDGAAADATITDASADGASPADARGVADAGADARPSASDASPDAAADPGAPMIVLVPCPARPQAIVGTQGQAFSPQLTTIAVGAIVRFEPTSSHDVVSGTNAAPTPSWFQVDGGAPRCYRFGEAGTFPFFCSIHANMTGVVTVAP